MFAIVFILIFSHHGIPGPCRTAQGCRQDIILALKECMVPEWLTFARSRECQTLGIEEKCNSLPGCLW